MTELQMSLMAIGGTIVVGVISYNKWQEYKARKSVQRAFSSEHDDVLMTPSDVPPGTRQEPTLAQGELAQPVTAETGAAESPSDEQIEKLVEVQQKELPVDDLIDCSISITLQAPLRGEKLLPKLQTLRHVGNKPVHFIGQREDSTWEPVAHGAQYYSLFAGVQLANRGGSLNEIEYSELIARLRQLADEMDADLDVPDMGHVMSRARSLHQFVAEYDAQLSVNVHSRGAPWAINTLLAALERQGFDLRPDGRLVMPDGEGGILFSLSTNVTLAAETTTRLTLLLDVPRVSPARDGFGAMIACARMLASRLDGVVVDDGNQPLADAALAEIAEQVDAFYKHMEAANIPAGSTRALRLFS
ncbi:cell division protein ZipA C-terminal FtsZ-binding domain-containing protein [Noviherbaspirillum denitrificans]|uniref:Cell division protein ZipA n=1 Tax=Noviherbaspirillum denitrificans TaxID=1968433 RepID=A0A254THT3_9BURK|nr:cell division protein ZipA C-terminal FtsZ-binding domain-containing protein [Noviherbaspirillum denitrificans]OWW22199.1 cell division protein [Noviherbaspirillum denitrificans]